MKKATKELIVDKINKDIKDVTYEIYSNKQSIKRMAERQKNA